MKRIYFDNAATTALDQEVLDAMMPYFTEKFGNPSSVYSYGRESKMAIESARKSVAQILNTKPACVFFTSGGTESNNTALTGAVRDLGCTRIISSPIEHHAVTHTIEHLQHHDKIQVEHVKHDTLGHVDLEHLESLLASDQQKTLVSLMHANNEIGNILDMKRVGELCKKYNAYFHSDTVQTVGHYPIDLQDMHVHFITGAAHKFHGPKGVGLLYIREGVSIKPFIFGGGQERNMRAGTENIYGVVGFAKALDLATSGYEKDSAYILSLKRKMKDSLTQQFPEVTFNGDVDDRSLYTVLSANFRPSEKSEMLLFNLDMHHICASSGSACSSGADAGSHVIAAIAPGSNHVTIRFSFCRHNTPEEVDAVIECLQKII